ncbi:MAG TPA: hypothetical protein VFU15_11935 [Bacteroidia bacterium]|nr:hypothetical protein [Bacteroidia bacterium]
MRSEKNSNRGYYLRARAVVLVCLFSCGKIFSQQANVPLNYDWLQESEAGMVKADGFPLSPSLMIYEADSALRHTFDSDDSSKVKMIDYVMVAAFPMQTSMRPWIEQGHPLRKNVTLQNNFGYHYNPGFYETGQAMGFGKKLRRYLVNYHDQNSLLLVNRTAKNGEPFFRLYIDPLLNVQYMNVSNDTSQSSFYINTRGITAYGDIGTKVSFETSFWENQAFFPQYISDYANTTQVVPGQGRWKTFRKTGYDYAMSTGYISYSPCRFFNVQAGHGKFFVGDGYRSLLLSDNGFAYPFARFTGWFGPFQYTAIYASLMNLNVNAPVPPGTEHLYQKKAASFYQMAMKLGRKGEISLFQGLIWTAADSSNRQCIRLAYVDPVMYTALPKYGLSSRDNFLIGATFRYDLFHSLRLYGQWMADDLGKKGTVHNKTGFQLGAKYFNAFTLKHLHLEIEYNRVNPYSYAATDPAQSYSQYNEPLAHPLGANFSEVIFSLYYKLGDFFLQARYSTAMLGADSVSSDNGGQDIFKTDYLAYYPVRNFTLGQGQKTTITYFDVHAGYMISYASNLNISAGYTARNVSYGATSLPTNYVYVAVRTSLTNTYYDFFRK